MRVALVTSSYNFIADGVALTLNRLVGYLLAQGVEVLVFAPTAGTPAFAHQGTVVSVPSIPLPGRPEYRLALGLGGAAKRALLDFQPDIIHIAVPDLLGHAALTLAQTHDIPAVASYHTRYETYLQALLVPGRAGRLAEAPAEALLWRHARGLCAVGFDARRAAGRRPAATISSPGRAASTPARFTPAKRSAAWRARHGIGADEIVILHVSRLVREKRLDTLTAALNGQLPYREGHRGRRPGPRLCRTRNCRDAIFTGFLDGEDLAAAYASSDLFIFPSDSESFGNVTLEAMASRPALRLRRRHRQPLAGGGRRDRLPGRCRRCATPLPRHLSQLATDAACAPRMGAAARARALTFSWDETLARMLGYYRALAGEPRLEDR